ncbi:MAG: lamin tail domain-containing protein [Patescibacteria group bacterium]|nr:lamin tail domain-containing protein [Patescibacteria group bacterium]
MRKGGIFLLVFLLLSFLFPFSVLAVDNSCVVAQGICINEFIPYPSSGDEWVEIINLGTESKDISNWYLDDIENGGSSPYKIQASQNTIILAGGVVLISHNVGFNNTGTDSVRLLDSSQALIDSYSYSDAEKGKSYGRKNNDGVSDWTIFDTPSPGELNPVPEEPPPTVYSTKILINEIFPAPGSATDWDGDGKADSYDEWIELINLDDGQIDLAGWSLDDVADDGSNPYTILPNTKIDPDGFKVFYYKDTGLILNNGGDSVILKDPNGKIVDHYEFDSTSTDKSFSRNNNSATSSWVSNYSPSPGRLNTAPGNISPMANAGSSINNAKVGETLNFNGSASSDQDGTIVSYEWNFGDGSVSSGAQTTHSYSTIGTYQVVLTVHDNAGATSSSSITVTVVAGEIQYQNQYSSNIKISEILPDPVGSDTEGEYIKIYNFGSDDVNLKNWSLDDEDGGSKPYKIDYDLVLKSKTVAAFYSVDTKISLNNTGDHARLFDPGNKLMDDIVYTGPVIEGATYTLENGKWAWINTIVDANDDSSTKKETISVPASVENKDLQAKNGSTNSPQAETKIPDLKKIAVAEPPIVASQSLSKKNEIPEVKTISEVIVISGTLASTTNKEKETISQKDFVSENSTSQIVQSPVYQKPIVIFSSMAISLLLITKALFRPEDWRKIWKKLFENQEKDSEGFENLFK